MQRGKWKRGHYKYTAVLLTNKIVETILSRIYVQSTVIRFEETQRTNRSLPIKIANSNVVILWQLIVKAIKKRGWMCLCGLTTWNQRESEDVGCCLRKRLPITSLKAMAK